MTAPQARMDVAAVTLDGETVIHRRGRVHVLDPVATLVWRCCDGDASVDEIAAELADSFGTSPATVRRDVGAAVDQLGALGLLDDAPADAAPEPDEPELLMDPPGSCASCAERPWTFRSSYRVGSRVVTVGTNNPRADAALRAALATHLVPTPGRAGVDPPFFGVEVHEDPPESGPQPLHLLHRGDTIAARSRHPDRILRALVAHLASYDDGATAYPAVNGLVVGRDGRAMIVAHPEDPIRLRHALGRVGVGVADMPVALVDVGTSEVVVGAPGLTVDLAPIDALAVETGELEPEPLPWGRYPVVAIGVAGTPGPSAALLALGPEVGDHRDHDRTIAALLALLDTVPVTDAVAPGAIGDRLSAGSPPPVSG